QHRVPRTTLRLVLGRLTKERIQIDLVAGGLAARHLEEDSHCRPRVLHSEQSGTVRGELALPVPFEQRQLEWHYCHSSEEWKVANADGKHDHRDRPVDDVSAHDVADFMSEDEALLLAVQQPQRLGVDDYERLREADSCRIDERRLSDVQRRPSCTFPDDVRSATGPVERLEHLGIERVQL